MFDFIRIFTWNEVKEEEEKFLIVRILKQIIKILQPKNKYIGPLQIFFQPY